jgi:hypothetical protein
MVMMVTADRTAGGHPLPSCNHRDGQTNWIKFIPFVCLSHVHASSPTPPAGIRYHRATMVMDRRIG